MDICRANVLIVENPQMYRAIVENLACSIKEDNEQWIFSDNEKELKKGQAIELVDSFLSIDFSNRKIQKSVTDNLYDLAMDEEHYGKTLELMSTIENYIYELEWNMEYDLEVSYQDFHNIIKAGVLGITSPESILEKFVAYIKLVSRLMKVKVIVLIGLQKYFNGEEWKMLELTACYEGVYLFCVEGQQYFEDENKILLDVDKCRVV